ncbi:MAG: class I adenylate-forming enzyme family protein, partial [bacterium]
RRESFESIERASARLAQGLLRAGVGKGTRVGVLFPNGPDWTTAFFAAARIGAITVALNTFYRPRELAWTLRHADVHTLLTVDRFLNNDYLGGLEHAFPELKDSSNAGLYLADAPYLRQIFVWGDCDRSWARPVAEVETLGKSSTVDDDFLVAIESAVTPSDSLVIVYTSGSTADPKGVLHSHGTVLRHSRELATLRGLRESDRVWLPMPLFWIGGFAFGLLGNMHVGATSVFDGPFEASRTLEVLERERITISTAWPHFVKALQEHPDFSRRDLSSVRSGETRNALQPHPERDPGLVAQPFGMTETCGPHTFGDITKDLPENLRGSFGIPLHGLEHKIVDPETGESLPEGHEGEICVRGWSLMQGLYKKEREETFDQDGYYHTGDGGYLRNGSLYFTGRLGDMIKTGGANVAPSEIEALLLKCPEVLEAYVTGLPDSDLGEIVAAAVVLKPDQKLSTEELRGRLKSQLSAFKLPKLLALFSEGSLPYTASGKIDKPGLKNVLEERMRGDRTSTAGRVEEHASR